MTPTHQPQPPLPTPPTSPSLPASSASVSSLKPRELLYLTGGIALLAIIAIASLKIIPPLLLQKTSPPNSQNSPIMQESPETTDASNWKEYTDSKIGYSIKYPKGKS